MVEAKSSLFRYPIVSTQLIVARSGRCCLRGERTSLLCVMYREMLFIILSPIKVEL